MKLFAAIVFLLSVVQEVALCQWRREDIYTDFVLYSKRMLLQKDLKENLIGKTFTLPLDSNTEYRYEAACNAVCQYMLADEQVQQGFTTLFTHYDELQYETKKALLEAVYGVYPTEFLPQVQRVLAKETQPKLFAIAASYAYRVDASVNTANNLKIKLAEQFPGYDTLDILLELEKYLSTGGKSSAVKTADIVELFNFRHIPAQKIIYSFQRKNRDYPGLAIVQNANGSFVKHPDGRLMIFEQLARSASNLPYFITNGNTPQGVYSIRGTAVANNKLIGPTPNLQLLIPYENKWENYFQLPVGLAWDTLQDPLQAYLQLLPLSWRKKQGMTEAYYAGKIGRNAIIAHGSTIDPQYFADKPYYPLTPTMGCLCARELWNTSNGRLLVSEQFNLVSAFTATPGYKGFLYVINVDDQQKAVNRAEVEVWVREYEKNFLPRR